MGAFRVFPTRHKHEYQDVQHVRTRMPKNFPSTEQQSTLNPMTTQQPIVLETIGRQIL